MVAKAAGQRVVRSGAPFVRDTLRCLQASAFLYKHTGIREIMEYHRCIIHVTMLFLDERSMKGTGMKKVPDRSDADALLPNYSYLLQ